MSQENVEILRGVYTRWGRGDFWTPEVFDPDVEVVWDAPDVGTDHGLAGLKNSIREWLSAWGVARMEADEFIDVAADRVLVFVAAYGRGQGSGVEVETHDWAHVWTMREGMATRLVGYLSRSEALNAVGLEE